MSKVEITILLSVCGVITCLLFFLKKAVKMFFFFFLLKSYFRLNRNLIIFITLGDNCHLEKKKISKSCY